MRLAIALLFLYLMLGSVTAVAQPSDSGSRVALVIGNSTYSDRAWPDLGGGPLQDARAMRDVLRSPALGFEVIYAENADLKRMTADLERFRQALRRRPGATGLIFFAGHGTQAPAGGNNQAIENYLIPVGTSLQVEGDARFEAMPQERLEQAIRDGGAASGILILDACRDNALQRDVRAGSATVRGLVRPSAEAGTLIAYSARANRTAYNTPGSRSEFTAALIEEIAKPGVSVTNALRAVRQRVMAATRQRERGIQEPEMLDRLTEDLVLVPARKETSTIGPLQVGGDSKAAELSYWTSIQGLSDLAVFRDYLEKVQSGEFPGTYRAIAEARLRPAPQSKPQPAPLAERFEVVAQGVLDRQQGVIWAARDNGADVSWQQAQAYCAGLGAGWSLPSVVQLKSLHDVNGGFARQVSVWTIKPATDQIEFSGILQWSAEIRANDGAWTVSLGNGYQVGLSMHNDGNVRALCVRRS